MKASLEWLVDSQTRAKSSKYRLDSATNRTGGVTRKWKKAGVAHPLRQRMVDEDDSRHIIGCQVHMWIALRITLS